MQRNGQDPRAVPQRKADGFFIRNPKSQEPMIESLQHARQSTPAMFVSTAGIIPAGRKHGIQCEGDKQRYQDRKGNGNAELIEEPPDNPFHERNRHKYRDNGKSGRHHRQTDFRSSEPGCFKMIASELHMPDDVFPNHDGVVDQEADRQRQSHKRQDIQRKSQDPHDDECRNDRDRKRQSCDHRAAPAVEKQEDNEYRKKRAQDQRVFEHPPRHRG